MGLIIEQGFISGARKDKVDGSALDLMLSETGFQMLQGSVKPRPKEKYGAYIQDFAKSISVGEDGCFHLKRRYTYIFKLRERLDPKLRALNIYGMATAKSSVGRVDVLARLIVDGMGTYEQFNADCLSEPRDMFVEVTPFTFDVSLKPNTALSQLRLFRGSPDDSELRGKDWYDAVLEGPEAKEGCLSVNLEPTQIAGKNAVAFVARLPEELKTSGTDEIALWDRSEKPNPWQYWDIESSDDQGRFTITPERFYILRSAEKIRLPPGVAVYCRASDETIGEMRIHYAGFVHPRFGIREDGSGTPLIFEVRGHQVNVSLAQGERMARLQFYRMSENAEAESTYNKQELQLSKFFGDWRANQSEG